MNMSIWFLVGAILVFFMQCGFAMVETGFTRAKNAGNIIMKNYEKPDGFLHRDGDVLPVGLRPDDGPARCSWSGRQAGMGDVPGL